MINRVTHAVYYRLSELPWYIVNNLPESLRYKIARYLSDRRGMCWADLVGWAHDPTDMDLLDVRQCNYCWPEPYTYCGKPQPDTAQPGLPQ